jgi:SAM-dependent methyltransferase
MQDSERARLLDRVRIWFDAPEQVQHYQNEVRSGPTVAEEWLLRLLPASGRVLDLGCGAGRIAVALARRGFEVSGVDVSAPLLEVATSIATREGLSAHFVRVDALDLPFADRSFDAAIAFKLYGYIPARTTRLAYLDEIYRVLVPGAWLLLTSYVVPPEHADAYASDACHAQAAAGFTTLEPGDTFCAGEGFVHWFTVDELRNELTASRFHLANFCSDEAHGGQGLIRLAAMTRPVDT